MKHLVVYEIKSSGSHDDSVQLFMQNLLTSGNFRKTVHTIWVESGSPPIYLVERAGGGSRLKRFRAIP